jgi:HAD superfamily hydrolase (TIGR01509 family)
LTASSRNVCVTFDLWETLIFDEPERDMMRSRMRYEGLHSALANLGIQVSLEDMKRAYEESAQRLEAVWKRNEDVSTSEQIRLIIELASKEPTVMHPFPGSAEMLEKAYVDPLFTVPPRLNEDALNALRDLRSRVHKIGLISNTGRTPGEALRRLLERYGLLQFFDATVFSDEVRYRKPNRKIFEEAANRLGMNLRDMIHIGDNPRADVWGAKQAGMRALLFEHNMPDISKWQASSLFVITRADRHISDSDVKPDRRIKSLTETLDFIDTFS